MTDTQLLVWGRQELDRQMAEDAQAARTCSRCGRNAAEMGYARWSSCDNCGKPICDRCAVQVDGCVFCPGCPHTTPF